jgi:hypothetical protein
MKKKSRKGWIESCWAIGKVDFNFSWNTLLISPLYKTKKQGTKKVRITIEEIK